REERAATTDPSPARTPSAEPSSQSPPGSSPGSPPETSQEDSEGSDGDIPAGFVLHRDPTGFEVAVPRGWDEVREGSRVDFREPGGGRFLRIDQTGEPKGDPLADWRRQEESVAQRLDGYRRLRLVRADYRDYDTADWEFTFQASSGRLHVLNRGLVTGPDHAYAIYWSTPADRWQDSLSHVEVFTRTFRPAG
ncbi:MAG: hypothetical protein ACRDPT_00005, partial [Streptomycetales bacterium]